jgi:hypothetical protein
MTISTISRSSRASRRTLSCFHRTLARFAKHIPSAWGVVPQTSDKEAISQQREITRDGKKSTFKAPKIQRLVTPQRLQVPSSPLMSVLDTRPTLLCLSIALSGGKQGVIRVWQEQTSNMIRKWGGCGRRRRRRGGLMGTVESRTLLSNVWATRNTSEMS